MRKIKFKLLTQINLEVLETSARTFGELKADMAKHSTLNAVSFNNSQLIERETKVMYGTLDDAVLPATDCIMFVTPVKTLSGADIPTITELQEMGYNELRSLGSKLNKENDADIDLSGKRDDILDRMEDFVLMQEAAAQAEEQSAEEIVDEIIDRLQVLKTKLPVREVYVEEVTAIKVTLEDLEAEARALKTKVTGK